MVSAAGTMRSRGFPAWPVLHEDGRLVGICTEADLHEGRLETEDRRRRAERPRHLRRGDTGGDVMTSPVESLTPGGGVADAAVAEPRSAVLVPDAVISLDAPPQVRRCDRLRGGESARIVPAERVAVFDIGGLTLAVFDTVLKVTSMIGSIVGTREDLAEVFRLHALGRTTVIAQTRTREDVERVDAGRVARDGTRRAGLRIGERSRSSPGRAQPSTGRRLSAVERRERSRPERCRRRSWSASTDPLSRPRQMVGRRRGAAEAR